MRLIFSLYHDILDTIRGEIMIITHDFHVHTALSLCAEKDATVSGYIDKALELGIKKIGFSDHFWDEKIDCINHNYKVRANPDEYYTTQNFPYISRSVPEIDACRSKGVEILFGCEAEYDPFHHGVALTEETAEKLDFVIVPNSHTHMMMPESFYEPHKKHIDFMINAFDEILASPVSRYITALAHPFEAVCCPYGDEILMTEISDDQYKKCFDKAANKNIAIEINGYSYIGKNIEEAANMPKTHMLRLAKQCGCRFLFGSDAHSHGGAHVTYATRETIVSVLDLKKEDFADIAF